MAYCKLSNFERLQQKTIGKRLDGAAEGAAGFTKTKCSRPGLLSPREQEVRDSNDELMYLTVYRKHAREVVRRLAA